MTVLPQQQNQPDQPMQQQQQDGQYFLVWQQEGIKMWAAMAAQRIVERLRDDKGNQLPSQILSGLHNSFTAYLDKGCTTPAMFDRRRRMAANAGKLLQFVLDLGFKANKAKRLVTGGLRSYINPAHAIAILNQLQQMNGNNQPRAVTVLRGCLDLLQGQPDALARKFDYMQQISGASPAQAASMMRRDGLFLMSADVALEASVMGLLDIGYSKRDCKLYARAPTLWCFKPDSIALKHTQLEKLLEATPAEIRSFVLKHPTVLHRNVTSDAFVGRIQLWVEEVGRPLRRILAVPYLFQYSLKRSAARIGFMQMRGHSVTPFARELCHTHGDFCLRFNVSEADFEDWHQKWLKTPMGLRYAFQSL